MAQQYYNMKQAAEALGVSEDEVKRLKQDRLLHGYRDGADWKFKAEDVDRVREQRAETIKEKDEVVPTEADEQGDVLLSEVELGGSELGTSGTVIGMGSGQHIAAGSDLRLADSDLHLGEEAESPAAAEQSAVDSKVAQFEELDLTLDQDLTLEDSRIAETTGANEPGSGDSAIDLTGDELEDDDLVLGGSGTGSDVTIGGDSGISLVDPSDSGLSLEEPLDLAGTAAESLELGEDDLVSLGEGTERAGPGGVKRDDDFTLTPLEDITDLEDSESGSQVIALDAEGDEAATMIAGAPAGGMAAMLDEDLSAAPAAEMAGLPEMAPLSGQPAGFAEGAPLVQSSAALPEMPYSIWNVLSLAVCVIFLALSGMFMYDLMRNMWSWNSPYDINGSMMDTILSWFGN